MLRVTRKTLQIVNFTPESIRYQKRKMNNKIQPISESESVNEKCENSCEKRGNAEARKDNENVYEEYDDVYEEYIPRYHEYKNTEKSNKEKFYQEVRRKWWIFCVLLVLLFCGIILGLSIHFTELIEQTNPIEPVLDEAVLMLSDRSKWGEHNVPIIIGMDGKPYSSSYFLSQLFRLVYCFALTKSITPAGLILFENAARKSKLFYLI